MAALLGAAGLTGCAIFDTRSQPSPTSGPIGFNYLVENGRAAGLDQAFEMNGNTVVQLGISPLSRPIVYDVSGFELNYKSLGQYIVLHGIHPNIRIAIDGKQATIRRRPTSPIPSGEMSPVRETVLVSTPAQAPESAEQSALRREAAEVEGYRTELARIRKELAEVKALLAEQARANREIQEPRVADFEGEPKHIRVTFKFNSADFVPSGDAASAIERRAPRAKRIVIRGYTDSDKPNQNELVVATNRAHSARRYLLSRGADDRKIQVTAQAAGGFIADNRTPEGRALNRRVEIDML